MKGISRIAIRSFLAIILILSLPFAASAQTPSKTSATIQLAVYVPPVLRLSLDFAPNGAANIVGYLGTNPVGFKNGFELKPYSIFNLGTARLVSNLSSSYSIVVQSMNRGKLKNQSSGSEIAYDLLIGGMPAARYGDSFRMVTAMKTARDGTDLPVSIALGNIPASASYGVYSDSLLFNVMAN